MNRERGFFDVRLAERAETARMEAIEKTVAMTELLASKGVTVRVGGSVASGRFGVAPAMFMDMYWTRLLF